MKFIKFLVILGLFSGFSSVSVAQNTVLKSMSISPYETHIRNNADFGVGHAPFGGLGGIIMPDPNNNNFGRSDFSMGFTLPEDYVPGSNLTLRILWRSDATNECNIDFRHNFLHWAQPGQETKTGQSQVGGLLKPSGVTKMVNERLIPIIHSEQPNFEPGDAISNGFFRTENYDTCSENLYILGLSVLYEGYVYADLSDIIFKNGFEV